MKKFLSAILSFAMIFALSIPAFAADITVAPTETVTNEYQSMLELQKISNATLAAEGYTPSEIETIRNTDQIFDDHIALLNTLSEKSANIKYSHINGTEPSYWQSPTYQKPESGMTSYGSGYSYNAALQDNYFYASEGYSIFVLSRQSSSHLETISRVSHQQGIATLNYSISSGFDIGISIGRKLLGDGHDETPA